MSAKQRKSLPSAPYETVSRVLNLRLFTFRATMLATHNAAPIATGRVIPS